MLGRAGPGDSPAGRVVHGVCGGVPNVPGAALLAGRRRRQGGPDDGELGVHRMSHWTLQFSISCSQTLITVASFLVSLLVCLICMCQCIAIRGVAANVRVV